MTNRVMRIVFSSCLIFLFLAIFITALYSLTKLPLVEINENSILYELKNIDYFSFFKIGLLCLFISAFIVYLVTAFCLVTSRYEDSSIERWATYLAKSLSAVSIIIPMTITLSKEQFNVATTYLSFLALFSFVMPKIKERKSNNTDSSKEDNS